MASSRTLPAAFQRVPSINSSNSSTIGPNKSKSNTADGEVQGPGSVGAEGNVTSESVKQGIVNQQTSNMAPANNMTGPVPSTNTGSSTTTNTAVNTIVNANTMVNTASNVSSASSSSVQESSSNGSKPATAAERLAALRRSLSIDEDLEIELEGSEPKKKNSDKVTSKPPFFMPHLASEYKKPDARWELPPFQQSAVNRSASKPSGTTSTISNGNKTGARSSGSNNSFNSFLQKVAQKFVETSGDGSVSSVTTAPSTTIRKSSSSSKNNDGSSSSLKGHDARRLETQSSTTTQRPGSVLSSHPLHSESSVLRRERPRVGPIPFGPAESGAIPTSAATKTTPTTVPPLPPSIFEQRLSEAMKNNILIDKDKEKDKDKSVKEKENAKPPVPEKPCYYCSQSQFLKRRTCLLCGKNLEEVTDSSPVAVVANTPSTSTGWGLADPSGPATGSQVSKVAQLKKGAMDSSKLVSSLPSPPVTSSTDPPVTAAAANVPVTSAPNPFNPSPKSQSSAVASTSTANTPSAVGQFNGAVMSALGKEPSNSVSSIPTSTNKSTGSAPVFAVPAPPSSKHSRRPSKESNFATGLTINKTPSSRSTPTSSNSATSTKPITTQAKVVASGTSSSTGQGPSVPTASGTTFSNKQTSKTNTPPQQSTSAATPTSSTTNCPPGISPSPAPAPNVNPLATVTPVRPNSVVRPATTVSATPMASPITITANTAAAAIAATALAAGVANSSIVSASSTSVSFGNSAPSSTNMANASASTSTSGTNSSSASSTSNLGGASAPIVNRGNASGPVSTPPVPPTTSVTATPVTASVAASATPITSGAPTSSTPAAAPLASAQGSSIMPTGGATPAASTGQTNATPTAGTIYSASNPLINHLRDSDYAELATMINYRSEAFLRANLANSINTFTIVQVRTPTSAYGSPASFQNPLTAHNMPQSPMPAPRPNVGGVSLPTPIGYGSKWQPGAAYKTSFEFMMKSVSSAFLFNHVFHSYIHAESRSVQKDHTFDFKLTKPVLDSIFPDPDDRSKDRKCIFLVMMSGTNIYYNQRSTYNNLVWDGYMFEMRVLGLPGATAVVRGADTYFDLTAALANYQKAARAQAGDLIGPTVHLCARGAFRSHCSHTRMLDILVLGVEKLPSEMILARLCARSLPTTNNATDNKYKVTMVPYLPGLAQASQEKLELSTLKLALIEAAKVPGAFTAGLANDDIEVGDTTVSFSCPLTLTRIKLPGKGKNCKHLQVFDIEAFLTFNEKKSYWSCIVCNKQIKQEELMVDGLFLKLLDKYPNAERCVIRSDGTDAPEVLTTAVDVDDVPPDSKKSVTAMDVVDLDLDDEVYTFGPGSSTGKRKVEVVSLLDSDDDDEVPLADRGRGNSAKRRAVDVLSGNGGSSSSGSSSVAGGGGGTAGSRIIIPDV
ncbi:hypothetical protein HDU76_004171, partial [Blyttiomyces sp. JEL0837]